MNQPVGEVRPQADLPVLQRREDILAALGEHQVVIVCGETGSGKTTTLYSALSELNVIEDKLITTEDPVEYDIDGIVQIPINHDIGVTFS